MGEGGLHEGSYGDPLKNHLFRVNIFDTGFHRAGESNIQAGDNRYKDGHSDKESGLRISFWDVK